MLEIIAELGHAGDGGYASALLARLMLTVKCERRIKCRVNNKASETRRVLIVFIVSGVLILKWIHRANYNARQLGATDMAFTPGWSIGWYFIPIANLWKPYQAMKEIWKASSNPQSWSTEPVSSMLPWWWFFWIVSGMLGNASFRLAMRAEEINTLLTANVVTQLSDLTGIPLSLMVLSIIGKVYEMQMRHAKAEQSM
jgi:hypothetical protein